MGKLIVMIPTSKTNSLFLYGLTSKDELMFKTSLDPKQLKKEKIIIHENVCYVGTYTFHKNALAMLQKDL